MAASCWGYEGLSSKFPQTWQSDPSVSSGADAMSAQMASIDCQVADLRQMLAGNINRVEAQQVQASTEIMHLRARLLDVLTLPAAPQRASRLDRLERLNRLYRRLDGLERSVGKEQAECVRMLEVVLSAVEKNGAVMGAAMGALPQATGQGLPADISEQTLALLSGNPRLSQPFLEQLLHSQSVAGHSVLSRPAEEMTSRTPDVAAQPWSQSALQEHPQMMRGMQSVSHQAVPQATGAPMLAQSGREAFFCAPSASQPPPRPVRPTNSSGGIHAPQLSAPSQAVLFPVSTLRPLCTPASTPAALLHSQTPQRSSAIAPLSCKLDGEHTAIVSSPLHRIKAYPSSTEVLQELPKPSFSSSHNSSEHSLHQPKEVPLGETVHLGDTEQRVSLDVFVGSTADTVVTRPVLDTTAMDAASDGGDPHAASTDGDAAHISRSSPIPYGAPHSPDHLRSSVSASSDSCDPAAPLLGESLLEAASVPQVAVHQPESRRYSSSGTASRGHSPRDPVVSRDAEAIEIRSQLAEMQKSADVAGRLSSGEEASSSSEGESG